MIKDTNLIKLLEFIKANSYSSSGVLYPDVYWSINTHLLLDEIKQLYNLTTDDIALIVNSKEENSQ